MGQSPPSAGTNPVNSLISDISLQNCAKIHFHCLSCPACSPLLWQPQQPNIEPLAGPKGHGMDGLLYQSDKGEYTALTNDRKVFGP